MNTFIPYADFAKSAEVLDRARLGNQFYREGMVIIRGKASRHPAGKMWAGYEYALGLYLLACSAELQKRGYSYPHWEKEVQEHMDACANKEMPPWLGREDVHSSHRANLLRKDPEHYGQFGWTEQPMEGYVWPV